MAVLAVLTMTCELAQGKSWQSGPMGAWGFLGGMVIAILLLAGVALAAVAIRGRIGQNDPAPKRPDESCSGELDIGYCRNCRFLEVLGEDHFCSKMDKETRGES